MNNENYFAPYADEWNGLHLINVTRANNKVQAMLMEDGLTRQEAVAKVYDVQKEFLALAVGTPDYKERLKQSLEQAKADYAEALKNATPEERYYAERGTRGEF